MDQVKASPPVPGLGYVSALARGLRTARETFRPEEDPNEKTYWPALGRLAIDTLIPQGLTQELADLSHGNLPLQIPDRAGGSLIPQFKKDRASNIVDLISSTPTPTKALGYVNTLRNAGKAQIYKPISVKLGATGDELDLAKKADSMYNMGSSNADVWATTGVTPIKGHEHRGATGGKYATETPINSANLPFKKHMLMGTEEKMDLLRMNDPESFYKLQAGHTVPQYIHDYLKSDVPIRGTRKLGDVYDISKVANKHPKLADSTLEVVQDPGSWRGMYFEPENKLKFNLDTLERDTNKSPFRHTTAHEWGGHAAQGAYNMPRGGSPAMMQMHKPIEEDVLGAVMHNLMFNKTMTPEERTAMIRMSQALRQPDPNIRYKGLFGEQQAETVANRATNNLYSLSPADDPNMVKVGGVDAKHWAAIRRQLSDPSGIGSFSMKSADQKTERILELLREANTKIYVPGK